jgi:hypothetical protein
LRGKLFSAGECILIETNLYEDGSPKAHLFVVILETHKNNDKTIIIPLCTIRANRYYDDTVVILPGEHDFVTDPTFADYYEARIVTEEQLDEMIQNGIARIRRPDLSEDLYNRIRDGIRRTDNIHPFIESHYMDYLIRGF